MTSCPCTIDNWIAAVWIDQGATARRSFHCLGSGVEVLPRWEADDGGASGPPGASTIENALLTSEWMDLVQLSQTLPLNPAYLWKTTVVTWRCTSCPRPYEGQQQSSIAFIQLKFTICLVYAALNDTYVWVKHKKKCGRQQNGIFNIQSVHFVLSWSKVAVSYREPGSAGNLERFEALYKTEYVEL